MTDEEFYENFPPGIQPPRELLKLLAYETNAPVGYAGSFHLCGGGRKKAARYFGNTNVAAQFVFFGCDSDGSVYAFWLIGSPTLDNSPIVYLDSDGKGSCVLASSISEFLGLLGLGLDELGYSAANSRWGGQRSTEEVDEFRSWLHDEFGMEVALRPDRIVDDAKRQNPDLGNWIENELLDGA